MSEYQYVSFRAIEQPVSEKNLEFMRKQSSRAEITPWSFDNEYNFGDFRGNAEEMLRRGYDFHLHYANFGIRTLMIRFPHGLPNPKAAEKYWLDRSFSFVKDKSGSGGILCVSGSYDGGDIEEVYEIEEFIDELKPLRAEILNGDLRPLYIARLAIACDSNHDPNEVDDAPVPAGLAKLTHAQIALAEFYSLSDDLITVAAKKCPPLPAATDLGCAYSDWIKQQPITTKNAWLVELLANRESVLLSQIRSEFQKSHSIEAWPVINIDRTIGELLEQETAKFDERKHKADERAERERMKRLAAMAADPQPTIRETERLVKLRTMETVDQIVKLLVELRSALMGTFQSELAETQAQKLRKEYPRRYGLVAALRKEGLINK